MSVDPDSSISVIYVRLFDEGTVVYRPVEAVWLSATTARLPELPDYDPDDENWEFEPGSVVRVERRLLEGKEVSVATALIE